MAEPLAVIGAGGHAKVVVAAARAAGFEVRVAYDDRQHRWGEEVLGAPIDGPVAERARPGEPAVLAIGANAARKKLAAALACPWITLVHPTAWVHDSARVGPGAVIFAGAVVQPDARIGAHAIVNTGATVDHDCNLGDFVHIAPGAHLAGEVTVGEGAFLGVGVAAIPGVTIGAWSTVGAGAAVVRDVPGDAIAVGVPARVRRAP